MCHVSLSKRVPSNRYTYIFRDKNVRIDLIFKWNLKNLNAGNQKRLQHKLQLNKINYQYLKVS